MASGCLGWREDSGESIKRWHRHQSSVRNKGDHQSERERERESKERGEVDKAEQGEKLEKEGSVEKVDESDNVEADQVVEEESIGANCSF